MPKRWVLLLLSTAAEICRSLIWRAFLFAEEPLVCLKKPAPDLASRGLDLYIP